MKQQKALLSKRVLIFLILITGVSTGMKLRAQSDTIVLKNNSIIDGKVKSINKDYITLKTSYSGNTIDFKLSELKRIDTQSKYLFKLKNGKNIVSSIHSLGGDSLTLIDTEKGTSIKCKAGDIDQTSDFNSPFLSRFSASIGLGLTVAKANNTTQLNTRNTIGFTDDSWSFDGFFNMIYTTQDSLASTKMAEGGIGVKYGLPYEWFLSAKLAFLSNSEQALKLRTSGRLGFGKNIIDKNSILWSASLGASLLDEQFSNATARQQSAEAFAATELKVENIKNITFLTSWSVYPGITEKGRIRSDLKIDIQYNLPHNFFIKAGTTYNYDNQPAAVGKELDYNYMLTFGWKL